MAARAASVAERAMRTADVVCGSLQQCCVQLLEMLLRPKKGSGSVVMEALGERQRSTAGVVTEDAVQARSMLIGDDTGSGPGPGQS